MTTTEIISGFQATIDQFYGLPKAFINKAQQHYIAGILQAALHILPTNRYFELKQYIYDTHGYDPGGCRTGQISLSDYKEK